MSKPNQSPLDPHRDQIEQWKKGSQSNPQIVANLQQKGVKSTERSVRRALKRWGIVTSPDKPEAPSTKIGEDEAEVISKASTTLSNPEDLMEERGLSLDEWEVVSITVNEWDGPTETGTQPLRQLKLHLRKKVPSDLGLPARLDGPKYRITKTKRSKTVPRKVVFVGDQQAPYQDKKLHQLFCEFLYDYKPDEGVLIGDTIDFPDISRHPDNPERDCDVQDCIDAGYFLLDDYRNAWESVYWKKLAGNHDERLRRYQIDKFRKSYNVRRAQVRNEPPESPVMDVAHLLRLDELDIEYIRPNGDYEHTQINVSPHLAARHGWIVRKGSGASALATLEHLGFSVVMGHTHRQSLVHKTRHDIDGSPATLAACETGCMCRIEEGLGYAVNPDWQNGFATAEIWGDGTFKIDLATYVNSNLYYRDRKYS